MSGTDGYWKNADGDKIQLFQNDIFVSRANGTIINGPATVSETYEHISVSYMDINGIYITE